MRMDKTTQKLQKLVKSRKSSVVVSSQKDFKQYKKPRTSSTTDYYSGSNT